MHPCPNHNIVRVSRADGYFLCASAQLCRKGHRAKIYSKGHDPGVRFQCPRVALPCIRPNSEYLSLHETHMITKKDTSFQGFALPYFAAEIALKPQFRAFFDALQQQGALHARDLVILNIP